MAVEQESKFIQSIRVIVALMIREMITRYGRSWGGYIWAILEPVGMIAILSLAFSQFFRVPPIGNSFILFYATGFIPFHFFNDITQNTSNAIRLNRTLMHFPIVTPLDVVLARFLLSVLTLFVVAGVVFSTLIIFTHDPIKLEFSYLVIALVAAASLGLGIGTANALIFAFFPVWRNVWGIINRPLLIISGVFFTYESLPESVEKILWWNPLVHIIAEARKAFYPTYDAEFVSLGFVFGVAAFCFIISGYLLVRHRSFIIDAS